jgi:hypothetical protein
MPKKRHPYLTKEFWNNNTFWRNEMHSNHEQYEERYKAIIDSFNIKDDNISTKFKILK